MKREQCAEITLGISGMHAMHFESRVPKIQWFPTVFDVVLPGNFAVLWTRCAYQLGFFSFQDTLETFISHGDKFASFCSISYKLKPCLNHFATSLNLSSNVNIAVILCKIRVISNNVNTMQSEVPVSVTSSHFSNHSEARTSDTL